MNEITGDAIAGCPDLAALETVPLAEPVRVHVGSCSSCRLVLDVFAEANAELDECERYDALLAGRGDGTLNAAGINLLERHLASCGSCRAVAETLSPTQDSHGDIAALPRVDPTGYALGLEVARGGMGRIIAARDLRVGRPVAVKELLGRSPALAARFEREARITARLQHPGIVPIYEIGRWPDGTPFYSMRMVEGNTLGAAIDRDGTLAGRLALLPALIAACEAVAYAHKMRVIHRDLTPNNVLVGAYGETVVIDWGLAKDLSGGIADDDDDGDPYRTGEQRAADAGLTGVGAVVGTLAYMPPEQAKALPVDERSDVYALGAILYHLLAGEPPFRARRIDDLLAQVKAAEPAPVDKVAPGSPRDLVSIVGKAMARSPDARYPSARELAEELKRFQTGRMVEAHHYSRLELVRRFVQRNRAAVTVTALAVIIVGTLGTAAIANVLRSREDERATARELVLEKGRIESLNGDSLRALAYLSDARQRGERGAMIDFLLGTVLDDVAPPQPPLECGRDDRYLEVSPDGAYLAAACRDQARIWKLAATPTLVHVFKAAPDAFDQLGWSHDGTVLAAWGSEGIARLWDTRTGKLVGEFPHALPDGKPSSITFATFGADDTLLATTGDDGYAMIWDIASGRPLHAIHGNTIPVPPLSRLFGRLTADDQLLTSTFFGNGAKYDARTGEKVGEIAFGSTIAGGEESPDGKHAVMCGVNGIVKVFDITTGAVVELAGHTDVVWKCVYSRDGKRLLSSSHDGTSKVWDLATKQQLASVDHGHLVWIGRFSPDGRRIVTISPGVNMKVWDASSGALLATYVSRGKDAQFLPDGRLAALRGDGRIQIWNDLTPRIATFSPPAGEILGVCGDGTCIVTGDDGASLWSPSGTRVAVAQPITAPIATAHAHIAATTATGVVVLDAAGKPLRELALPAPPVRLVLSADGLRLAIAWDARPPEIWDVPHARKLATLAGADRVLLDPDGTRAIAWRIGRGEQPISEPVIWNVDAQTPITSLPVSDAQPIGFAAGGTRVVMHEHVARAATLLETQLGTAAPPPSEPATATIWDIGSRTRIVEHPRVDVSPSIDPTGQLVTTINTDREVTVWNAADGSVRSTFTGQLLQQAQVNGDGNLIAAIGDYGRAVMIINAHDGRVLARRTIDHAHANIAANAFSYPAGGARWTPDSTHVVGWSHGFLAWRVTNPYDDVKIAEIVRKQVPWRIVNGRLEPIRDGRLSGRVVRNGRPVANALVKVEIRRPADVGAGDINWDSMKAKIVERELRTDADGDFALDNLVAGEFEYRLSVTAENLSVQREVFVLGADEDPIEIELER